MTFFTKNIAAVSALIMLGAVQASPFNIHNQADLVSFGGGQKTAPILGFDSAFDSSAPILSFFGQTLLSNNDSGFVLGLRSSSQRFSVLSGEGEGSDFSGGQGFGTDQTYFHGGSWQPYSYSGFDWNTSIGAKHSFGLARVEIDSVGLEPRSAEKISFSGKHFELAYTQVDRSATLAAQSIDLSLNLDQVRFDAKHFTTVSGGQLNELVVSCSGSSNDEYGLSFSVKENDLLEEEFDSRVLFKYYRNLGVQFNQVETEQAPKKTKTAGALIGSGLVLVALSGSSGSSNQDNAHRFTEQDIAARDILNRVNPISISENLEYGGYIYQSVDERYVATDYVIGTEHAGFLPFSLVPIDYRDQISASYHTHGNISPFYVGEAFSPVDLESNRTNNHDGYLGTPLGKFLWYDVDTDRAFQIGTIAN